MSSNEIWVTESPMYFSEGAAPLFNITYKEASAALSAGATMAVYKNGAGSDLSSTMCSGSISASGNILTLKTVTFAAGTGGNDYVIVITATVDSVVEVRKIMCIIQKAKTRQ